LDCQPLEAPHFSTGNSKHVAAKVTQKTDITAVLLTYIYKIFGEIGKIKDV
jgi:hypothetical protein